jgi:hypothetical protein
VNQAEEWDDMNEQTRNEIIARNRLNAAIADVDRAALRVRLANGSRSGLGARLAQTER